MNKYTEILTGSSLSCSITTGDGRIHDHYKGWGTISPDGKSITWDTYRPPTPEEIEAARLERERIKALYADPKWVAETEAIIDKLYKKAGTTREKVAKTILDVIEKAPPLKWSM